MTSSMKIAMIGSRGLDSNYSGLEKTVREITLRLVKKGHIVTIFSPTGGIEKNLLEEKFPGVIIKKIITLPGKHTETLVRSFISSLTTGIEEYDAIHYHAEGPGIFSSISRLLGKKTVVTIHGLDWKRDKWSPFAKFCLRTAENIAANCAHRIVVVSRTLISYFKEKYGKDAIFIPNGIPEQKIIPATNYIHELKLAPGNYCLFASRLVPEKGCHQLIESYNTLTTGKKLVIAGGSRYQSDYIDDLKKMADPEKIIFTGHVDGEMLEQLFAHCHFFVLPSFIEGLSNALLEAISYHKCTLVSNIPENLEVIEDCGFSFKVGDIYDLTKMLHMLLNDPVPVKQMEEKVKNILKDTYSWDRITAQYEEVYQSLLGYK
jgi:glycosyltransferase involved in cell wall biosynthesis